MAPFPGLATREQMRDRVHGILVGEMQAMEGAGRTVYDFPDAPWEFTLDMARRSGTSPATSRSTRAPRAPRRVRRRVPRDDDPLAVRLRGGRCRARGGRQPGLEGLACDVFNQLVHIARKLDDPILERAVGLRARGRDHPRADGLAMAEQSSPG
jgi:hypothetical protein